MSAKPLNLYDPEIDKFVRTRLAEALAKREIECVDQAHLRYDHRQKIYTWMDLMRVVEKSANREAVRQRKAKTGEWDEP